MTAYDGKPSKAVTGHPALARGVWIRACCDYVPKNRVAVEHAVANGWYAREDQAKDGYTSIAVEDAKWPTEMAREVGQAALRAANVSGEAVGMLTYASIHRHGNARLWQPAAYLQTELNARNSTAFSLSHGCNGLFVAARLALDFLHSAGTRDALLIGADRFGTSSLDRWRGDYGVLYGDAAAAILLSNSPGFARVLHCEIDSVPMLEGMHRHASEHDEGDGDAEREYGIRESKRAFMAIHGREFFFIEIRDALLRLRHALLERFDLVNKPADFLITPNIGRAISEPLYIGVFAALARRHYGEIGQAVGHTGTADQFLSLAELVRENLVAPGQRVLLIGAGAGFSCSALLIQIEDNHITKANYG